jgi:hypothetical protein
MDGHSIDGEFQSTLRLVGWVGAPWYVGPHPYFAAYPEYPSAASWLTDYAIGETLSDAYQLDADAELDNNADYSADVSTDADESPAAAALCWWTGKRGDCEAPRELSCF